MSWPGGLRRAAANLRADLWLAAGDALFRLARRDGGAMARLAGGAYRRATRAARDGEVVE